MINSYLKKFSYSIMIIQKEKKINFILRKIDNLKSKLQETSL